MFLKHYIACGFVKSFIRFPDVYIAVAVIVAINGRLYHHLILWNGTYFFYSGRRDFFSTLSFWLRLRFLFTAPSWLGCWRLPNFAPPTTISVFTILSALSPLFFYFELFKKDLFLTVFSMVVIYCMIFNCFLVGTDILMSEIVLTFQNVKN